MVGSFPFSNVESRSMILHRFLDHSRPGKKRGPSRFNGPSLEKIRQRATLPRPLRRSTIAAEVLNDRVRNGNGCGHLANATGKPDHRSPPRAERWVKI